jgi:hypothetical protein
MHNRRDYTGASHPLPFLDDLPVGLKDALADADERFVGQYAPMDSLDLCASNSCPVFMSVVLFADFLEMSRRTPWPFHIHNPERTITGTKTNRVAGA